MDTAHGDQAPAIHFTSRLPAGARAELEALLFFNENQSLYRDVVIESIERFGEPRIKQVGELLRLETPKLGEVQSLFAVERQALEERPVAVAVYARTTQDTVTILHVVVDSDFSTHGRLGQEMVTLRLVRQVVRSVARIKGVRRVEMLYGSGRGGRTEIRVRGGTD